MDLNFLYSRHQISLIHAAAAGNLQSRARHLASAGRTADLIREFQLAEGATAALSWNKDQALGGAALRPGEDTRLRRAL